MRSSPHIEKLRRDHAVESFDCGKEPLNRFLVKFALQSQQSGAAQTYVAVSDNTVAGYYSLVVAQVEHAESPPRFGKGMPRHPIPIMLIARLAVALTWQGQGLGGTLLRDAVLRTLHAADIAGIRGLAVHAKDEEARAFYRRFDFEESPTDPFHLFVLLKDLRK